MIRYDYDLDQIESAVDALDAKWRDKAAERTAAFIAAKRFDEPSHIWSDVTPVFIEVQNRKCIFCERQFESPDYGKIEYDLEHFRPKSSVKAWPPAGRPSALTFPMGEASEAGYYWLAYDLSNYAASCKVCNSPLKSNYFPVAGRRATTRRSQLAAEQHYLCYPIGRGDEAPEKLVSFIATTAVPVAKAGHKRRRGEVIIDFFQLNEREQLHRERARLIALLGGAMKFIEAGIEVDENRTLAEGLVQPTMPHTACLKAYRRLWDTNGALARRVHSLCRAYAVSKEGTKPPDV